MKYIPCHKRKFMHQINRAFFYKHYLRWFLYLSERLGVYKIIDLWLNTFLEYDDKLLKEILSSGWETVRSDNSDKAPAGVDQIIKEMLSKTILDVSEARVEQVISSTPHIIQISDLFGSETIRKEMSTYDALHLHFDGLAYLAETVIKEFGKQGELIIYDLILEDRIASVKKETGSVEKFISRFTAKPEIPNMFTAGLETRIVSKSKNEVRMDVIECEWARYYRERHPEVGYLMACSSDEEAYRTFNNSLKMQRTQTLMEGGNKCDFRIFSVGKD